ncbi:hypothetical protein [Sphingobacterium siyangense]|nr:hypothetical protein [Sphingobacterium siyangense]
MIKKKTNRIQNIKLYKIIIFLILLTSFNIVRAQQKTGIGSIDTLIFDLKTNMEGYLHENNPPYVQDDIDLCIATLSDYVVKVLDTKSKDEGMKLVKATVLKLNELNEKCDYSLIETNEREQIAQIIILAGHEKNYNAIDEDITEEWREW